MKHLCVALGVAGLAMTAAHAYEGMDNDFAACTQGQGKVSNEDIVAACTRLINNAAKENEMVGFFYAMRAATNNDKKSNCRDAKKVLTLTQDPTFVNGAKAIIKTNC